MTGGIHILWDWNGTLLDDTTAALDTLNYMITERGGRPISMAFYRDNFSFPVKPFYERIGVFTVDEDWDMIAKEYHDVYARMTKRLNAETIAALETVRRRGMRQSVLSALRQDLLENDLVRYGIADRFDFVCGSDNLDGAGKLDRAKELAAKLAGERLVVIGDSLHDHEVAAAIGAECILCAQGGHSAARLAAVAPTGLTLSEALAMIS